MGQRVQLGRFKVDKNVAKSLNVFMTAHDKIRFLPMGGVLDFYLTRGFLRVFLSSLLIITALFMIVELFDRADTFFEAGAPLWSVIRYFVYKTPLSISRMIGFATLFSTLFSLGMLARTQEITAMRASGLSVQRIALPLVIVSLVICGATFFLNESLVPVFSQRADAIYRSEIRNKKQESLFGNRDIWLRDNGSFINIDHFDIASNTLEGVTVFLLNRDFSLHGFVEIPRGRWKGDKWEFEGAIEWRFLPDGKMASGKTDAQPLITETPEDLKLLERDATEFTYFDLQKQIADMKAKGFDTTAYEVDLQTKLALPFISPLMVLLAVPFALKKHISGGVALSFGAAMLIGFGYWVLIAFCISLGHGGALPAWLSAWAPNIIFTLIGIYFFTAEE
jgi:lipopolysaccharide export system permease protein